jgi:hypothetical protein
MKLVIVFVSMPCALMVDMGLLANLSFKVGGAGGRFSGASVTEQQRMGAEGLSGSERMEVNGGQRQSQPALWALKSWEGEIVLGRPCLHGTVGSNGCCVQLCDRTKLFLRSV